MLEARGLTRGFGAVEALAGASFTLHAGEVLAVVGDNGAGKTTLFRVLHGSTPPDDGTLLLDGNPVRFRTPADARRAGVETVHQDLALCGNLDTVANLFLGRERVRRGLLDEPAMEQATRAVLGRLGVTLPDLRLPVETLSGGQRQCIAVARAMLGNPRVVLLDEPTAALGVRQADEVLRVVRGLRDGGVGIMLVSHNLADVLAVADRVLVLRHGRVVGLHRRDAVTRERVVAEITGATTTETAA
ncbi:MAG: sugar ABC transporter ATP-binding protein [Deltaproteobacteria bacterium]|nr:sugar ABC transporter ATP-binding protein [Deltaproteobacteria bacterium]